jgi:hypothetical protein
LGLTFGSLEELGVTSHQYQKKIERKNATLIQGVKFLKLLENKSTKQEE